MIKGLANSAFGDEFKLQLNPSETRPRRAIFQEFLFFSYQTGFNGIELETVAGYDRNQGRRRFKAFLKV